MTNFDKFMDSALSAFVVFTWFWAMVTCILCLYRLIRGEPL